VVYHYGVVFLCADLINAIAPLEEDEAAADGGFILYQNMSDTSQIQSVYSKR